MTTDALSISLKRTDATWLTFAGRLLLASIFIVSGLRKLGDLDGIVAYMASNGIPLPSLLVWPAIVVELGSGLLLLAGLWTRWIAIVLLIWTLVLAMVFHPFWSADPKAYGLQLNLFLFHLETAGGLLYIVAFGAGRLSLDHHRNELRAGR